MREAFFAVPGDLSSPTGGYAYARRLLALVPLEGVDLRHLALPGSFPHPTDADLAWTARLIAATPADAVLLMDGLAFGSMPERVVAALRRPIVALVHHPLAHETGLSPRRRAALHESETRALSHAQRVVAASRLTARVLAAEFVVPENRIVVAEPGTEPAPRSRGTGNPVTILAVGAVSARKGFDILVSALAGLGDLPWRATIAGALDRDPSAAAELRDVIRRSGSAERFELAGAVDDATLEHLYARTDIFVSASLYEGYGMVLAEAMARGLPLVVSTGGAAAETVPDEAALKVPPGDVGALREALRRLVADGGLRLRMAQVSWQSGRRLPRWTDTAVRVARVLKETRA